MSVIELGRYVARTTLPFRKGEEVTVRQVGSLEVTTVDDMPPAGQAPPDPVDVHFMLVGFTEGIDRGMFLALLKAACDGHGEFADVPRTRLLTGPSYIELGAWLGDQGLALRFLALGEKLGLWEVVTPKRLKFPEEAGDALAGHGFVRLGPKPELKEVLT
jgi:hypothetical protein